MVNRPREANLIGCNPVDCNIITISLISSLVTTHEDFTENEFKTFKGKGGAVMADACNWSSIICSQRLPHNNHPV